MLIVITYKMDTPLTNTQMLDNVVAILSHIKLNDELDNHDNFKQLMIKAINAAMEGNKTVVVKQKKNKSTPYTEFVKANMSKVAHLPKDQKFKEIAIMWKDFKAANWNVPGAVKKEPVVKAVKAVKEVKAPTKAATKKEPKPVKEPTKAATKKTVVKKTVDSSDDAAASDDDA
jgi:hypothetical protein